jgi:hypothetical protein
MLKKLVTGYIPIQGHPRAASTYGELGEIFTKLDCVGAEFNVHPFYEQVGETWLWKLIKNQPYDVSHSAGDNPKKNSLAYHCVNHQKFGWLLKAALADPTAETYVWMDYGIAHQKGVTPDVINEFMASIRKDDFAIPGCWPKEGLAINDFFPCWRFCGSVFVVPRKHLKKLYKGVKYAVAQHMQKHRNLPWEVNTLAEAEKKMLVPPIRWYAADHDASMFTNYAKDLPPCSPTPNSANSAESTEPTKAPSRTEGGDTAPTTSSD